MAKLHVYAAGKHGERHDPAYLGRWQSSITRCSNLTYSSRCCHGHERIRGTVPDPSTITASNLCRHSGTKHHTTAESALLGVTGKMSLLRSRGFRRTSRWWRTAMSWLKVSQTAAAELTPT